MRVLVPTLIVATTFIAYVGTLQFDFINDDHDLVLSNPVVYSWRFLPRYFTSSIWSAIAPTDPSNHYRPLFLLWLRLNHMLFALRPFGWHLTTVLLHVLVTFLVYRLARRLLSDEITAGIAALIFGLHPVHLEAVAWVSGVTEPLGAVFAITAFLAYLNSREEGQRRSMWFVGSLILYALATLAKETAVVLPAVVLAYAGLFPLPDPAIPASMRRKLRSAIREALPYFGLSVVYLLARFNVLGALSYASTPLSPATVFLTLPSVVWFYLRHLVWPVNLSPYYDLPYVNQPVSSAFLLPLAALVVVGIVLWWSAQRSPVLLFSVAWIFLFLAPVLDVQVYEMGDIVRDRFLYLPSVGFALLAAVALRRVRLGGKTSYGQRTAQLVAVAVLALLLAVGTVSQSLWWANDLLHASRSVARAPGSVYALHNLATELGKRGRWDEAIRLYQKVLERRPDYWPSLYNLGVLYYQLGQPSQAERFYQAALRTRPNDSRAYLGLGLARWQQGRLEDAERLIRRALALQPQGKGYQTDLGLVLVAKGDIASALEAFRAELRLYPDDQLARRQIAQLEFPTTQKPAQGATPGPAGSLDFQKH